MTAWLQGLLTPSGVWSIITAAVSIGGLWLSTIEPRWGWRWGIGAQVVWLVAGFATHRPGDVALSIVFTVIYVRGLRTNRGASYRDQRAVAADNEQLRAELVMVRDEVTMLRSRCPAGVS